jgi:hypothetical protein
MNSMNDWTPIIVVMAVVLVGIVVWMSMARRRRTRSLRDTFGPEYDRELQERGSRRRVEHELRDREKRVKTYPIRPLPPTERSRYAGLWSAQQVRFVDDPRAAVEEADHLVEEVMSRRGYPVDDFDRQAADLSVEYPHVVENYRYAHDIAVRQRRGEAGTEDLRKAMIYYRTLFEELLGDRPMEMPAR